MKHKQLRIEHEITLTRDDIIKFLKRKNVPGDADIFCRIPEGHADPLGVAVDENIVIRWTENAE